ncbi:MAG: amino acid ABC transporter permease [Gammaproteobacteria bacterium]|nr:amino acid ABC transporter permease [Gammaproteobacteria bacterium]MXY91473.1 amino acid ABC transporter permease [Gammaproteobacteria bacterium]MXZ33046.1 amino acid ABC transporter permease [Gammaproteobacteria bacterium]MYA37283.1 amino acid ABC transporter permease [Gammaproteobacteria bacterium]MYA67132.1 amino acid ABC transporter permease [Gammaproteobacteria bacterium]
MQTLIRRFTWIDAALLAVLAAFAAYVWIQIDGRLNYVWRWEIIPAYMFRFDEAEGRWVANLFVTGFLTTLRICIYASVLALIFGVILGLARTASNLTVNLLARTWLECLRNVPPVVVVFIFYFFLSEQLISAFGIEQWAREVAQGDNARIWEFFVGDPRLLPVLLSGTLVLALFESAFVGEIVRAGLESVDPGQKEAARALGMGSLHELRFVVLPQAMRKALPPMANQFITLVKDSSIVSLISVQELTYRTVELVSSTRAVFEAWITTAAFYFVLCFGLSLLFRRLEFLGRDQ